MTDAHGYLRRVELVKESIKQAENVTDFNKLKIIEFVNYYQLKGVGWGRLHKYLYTLRNVAVWLAKDFDKVNRKYIEELIRKIDGEHEIKRKIGVIVKKEKKFFTIHTRNDYRDCVKIFWRWLKGLEDERIYPDEVRWIRSLRNNGRKLPEELLTEEDIKKMVDAADNPRDKAIIFCLYETGARIGELAAAKIKHCVFDKYGAQLIVDGKTGMRRVRLVSSVPLLSSWISFHSNRDNPDAPLWIGIGKKNKTEAVSYNAISMMLKGIARKAGVTKHIYPHLFRHSRATELAKYLTEAQLKEVCGWTQGSDVASVYIHLSGKSTDDALLRLNGIVDSQIEKPESKLKPKKCERCDFVNPATNKFCGRCSAVLDLETAIQLESAQENFINLAEKASESDRKKLFEIKKEWKPEREGELEDIIRRIVRQEIKK